MDGLFPQRERDQTVIILILKKSLPKKYFV